MKPSETVEQQKETTEEESLENFQAELAAAIDECDAIPTDEPGTQTSEPAPVPELIRHNAEELIDSIIDPEPSASKPSESSTVAVAKPAEPAPEPSKPTTLEEGMARIAAMGREAKAKGLSTPKKMPGEVTMATVRRPAQETQEPQYTKPKLNLPSKDSTVSMTRQKRPSVSASANIDTVAVHPNPLASATSMPATQKSMHTDPLTGTIQSTHETQRPTVAPQARAEFVNSVHETLPQHRIFQGVAATQLSGNSALPTSASHPVEDERHMKIIEDKERERDLHIQNTTQSKLRYRSSSAEGGMGTIARSFSDFIGFTKPSKTQANLTDPNLHNMNSNVCRDVRLQLSMNDPSLPSLLRKAHQEWVKGTPLQEMKTMGIGPDQLIKIGVNWSDWAKKQHYGVKELAFMGGEWRHAVQMGFEPADIVRDRNLCGPNLLREYWKVTYSDLEWDLGITVDEAVGKFKFTTADFAVLDETLSTLIRKGFGQQHISTMDEPASSFTMTLGAEEHELRKLFDMPDTNHSTEPTGQVAQQRAFQEVHARTGARASKPTLKRITRPPITF